jgi:hypothetical protein
MGHNGYMRGVCTGGGIIYQQMTPAGRSTPQCSQEPGFFSPPGVVAFSALPHLLPFIILKENVHYLAVLISGNHGPVVFIFEI